MPRSVKKRCCARNTSTRAKSSSPWLSMGKRIEGSPNFREKVTSGYLSLNEAKIPGKYALPNSEGAPILKIPEGLTLACLMDRRPVSSSLKNGCRMPNSLSPSAVGTSRLCNRVKSGVFISSSSFLRCWLIADGVIFSSLAAATMLWFA